MYIESERSSEKNKSSNPPRGGASLKKKADNSTFQNNTVLDSESKPNVKSNLENVLQPKALSIGRASGEVGNGSSDNEVVQRVILDVGKAAGATPGLQSQADVLAAGVAGDTLLWPTAVGNFNGDYAGSVALAMTWGLGGGEGTSGWYGRSYQAADFNAIATAAGIASNNLAGIDGSLNNNKNKTLIAIRAFRGPNNGNMAGQTENDLGTVYASVNGQGAALNAAGLINDPLAAITSVIADPAEAHPNTLPTAKVTFGDAGTVYFKGRSQAVEDALVGTGPSAALAMSSLAGANPNADSGVGMHGFVDPGAAAPSQIAGDVGVEVAPVLTPVTAGETAKSYLPGFLGGAFVPPRPEATAAWKSSMKGALLASLSATTDLHPSNIKAGRSGKKHLIDGEFLLDVTQWQAYQNMLGAGAIANFDIGSFVPPWLTAHMATLGAGTKNLMADQVVAAFMELGADKTHVWAEIIAPLRALIQTPELLRVIPLGTNVFLNYVTNYNNAVSAPDRTVVINYMWGDIVNDMNGIVTVANVPAAIAELRVNLENGMVPLFHIRANDGEFLLNKQTNIGNANVHHSVDDLLVLAGAAVSRRYVDMAAMVRTAVIA
ncbi:MAG: hypothetical protein ACJA1C_000998 [Crocinitomicaceae bacterium]|jgi:hypothetical protein